MNKGTISLIVFSISLLLSSSVWADFIYVIDDGTGENGIARTSEGDLIWANQFTANGGADVITEIQGAIGVTDHFDGHSVTASLWNDVNNDGDPTDAVLLTSVTDTVANTGTDFFNVFDISDTPVNGSFFASLTIYQDLFDYDLYPYYPARFDAEAPFGLASWINLGTGLPGSTPIYHAIFDYGDFMIRAIGTEPIPEPTTMLLLGTGLVGVAGAARRKKKNQA